jgi:hypothetical protein
MLAISEPWFVELSSRIRMLTIGEFSLIANSVGFIALSYILSQRRQTTWLLSFIGVLGLMLIVQIEKQTASPDEKNLVAIMDLLSSGLSTYILLRAAFQLMGRDGIAIKTGMIVGLLTHGFLYLYKDGGSLKPLYETTDAVTCFIAAVVFAIALAQAFASDRRLSIIAFVAPFVWGAGNIFYWIDDAFYQIDKIFPAAVPATDLAMVIGLAGTSTLCGLLALRLPPAKQPALAARAA